MQQFQNILAALAILAFAASISILGESSLTRPAEQAATVVASSTLEAVVNPEIAPRTSSPETSAPTPAPVPVATAPSMPEAPAALPKSEPAAPANASVAATASGNALLEGSIVNIICSSSGTTIRSISGSGVVMDSRGLILTAAHIAQYLLLEDYPKKGASSCTIRTGSPARDAYTAALVYISSDWVKENAKTLVENNPTGTGENDFAVIAITGSATSAPLPSRFSFVPMSAETPQQGEPVTIGAYAAEFLSGKQIRRSLYSTIATGSVRDRYTFKEDTVDLIALGGSAAAQEGSSGGAVVNDSNELIGVITTSTTDKKLATRDLHAVTMGHIRRSFAAETGQYFNGYIEDHTPAELVSLFEAEAKSLSKVLIKAID